MTTKLRALLALDDPAATDPAVVGHKAATLAVLRQLGHRVPPGAVLPVACSSAVPVGGSARAALPPEMAAEVEAMLDQLGGVVAVRSSGVAEDLPDASWAGQYESVLDVRTVEELWAAISACLGSARSLRAVSYARGDDPAVIAVLIQRQVDADAAGVAFTANPVTGDDETVVSAVRGLGDRLVGGMVTPEDWSCPVEATPTRVAGPEEVLDVGQVAVIAAEARRIAKVLGAPADVEWALAGGELHVLQARPITVLPVRPDLDLPTVGTWEKDASHFTDPLSPVGATLYFAPFADALGEMARTYGLLIDGAEQRCLGGEMYTRIIPPGGKDGPAPPWWLLGVLLRVVPSMRGRYRTARRALADDLPARMLARWPSELRPELQARIADLRGVDLHSLDDAGLRAHLDRVCQLAADGQRIHFLLFVPYCIALHDLCTTVAEVLGWDESAALELVGGLSTASSAPARDLHAVAGAARAVPAVSAVLAGWAGESWTDTLDALCAAGGAHVADRLEGHLEAYGCRTTGYDPGRASMAERPDLVLGIVRDLVSAGTADDDMAGALARRRADADGRVDAELDRRRVAPADRARLRAAIDAARAAWPVREDNLFWTDSMPSGVLRLAVLEVGGRLAAAGHLRQPADACWLEGEEIHAVLDGSADRAGLAAIVARRKAEYAWVAAHPGPAVIGPPASGPPDLRAAPEAVRRTSGAMLWMIAHEYPGERAPIEGEIRGTPGAPGRYTGPVRVVRSDDDFDQVRTGEVLVCPITTPVWSVLFSRVGALVTDAGGALSHAAIVAREHDVPAVLGTVDGTDRLRTGDIVTVHGTTGVVEIHEPDGT